MTKPHGKHDGKDRALGAVTAEPTLEIDTGSVDDVEGGEFDGPTQLVDAGTYAATVLKAQRSDEGGSEEKRRDTGAASPPRAARRVDEETQIAPANDAPKPAGRSDSGGGGLFPELPHVQLPQTLGQYTLIELLGLGGMAEVFLAQQDGPGGFCRKLVIKRIHPHLSVDDRFVQMFLREARVAAGLQHRNIVRIDELGAEKGVYYIAMELVDGLTLQRLAQRVWRNGLSLPMELAVAAAVDAASALHYAHSYVDPDGTARRIVHRDVSPDNLIIDRAGNTKLLDFGVAKAAGSISVTRAGEVKGKVPYMAPEQLHGRPLDGRSDLYSLGATLYWLLTGKRPFRGETDLELMQAIAYEEPVPPRELNPEVPEVIEKIILRLLSKHPEDRHDDGQQLADELTAMLLPSRKEVSLFVEEAMALDHVDDAEPLSVSSFIAATPRTAHFITESRRLWLARFLPQRGGASEAVDDNVAAAAGSGIADEPAAPPPPAVERAVSSSALDEEDGAADPFAKTYPDALARKKPPVVAIAAGAAGALALAIVGWSLSGGDDDGLPAAPPPVVVASTASSGGAAPSDGDSAWNFLGEEADAPPTAAADAQAKAASKSEKKATAEPASPSLDDAAPSQALSPEAKRAAPVETSAPVDEDSAVARPESRRAATTVKAAKAVKVRATAPSNVVWRLGKRVLGSGDTTLEVPDGTTAVYAFHKGRQVRTRVPVQNGKVSYAEAPTGMLDIRVVPYATIYAGSEKLWKVPGPPGRVPAGTYKLRIEYEGKSKTETITVEPGATAKVRVNMME